MTKFLIHSNGPNIKTGYGVQTGHLVERLHRAGHEVAISSYVGQFGTAQWNTTVGPVPVYPSGVDAVGNDMIHVNAAHFFQEDPSAGWIIVLTDLWGVKNPLLREFQVAGWCPIDHYPAPPEVSEFFVRSGAVPIAMSRFGENALREAGFDPLYAPLSVDTAVYKPTPEIADGTAREWMSGGQWGDGAGRLLTDDHFVVMMAAMNKGIYPDRKGFGVALQAFGMFAATHPDAVLYMHTEQLGQGGVGIDLVKMAIRSQIPAHQILWANQTAYRFQMPPHALAACYTGADVLLAPSAGEGFCVPLIEAQACGTPVIVSDFSAQPELVGAGWKVGGQPFYDPYQETFLFTAAVADLLEVLEDAYQRRGDAKLSTDAIEFAAGYDCDRVFSTYWQPVLDRLDYTPPPLEVDRSQPFTVDVLCPLMRKQNVTQLCESFIDTNTDATLWLMVEADDAETLSEASKYSRAGTNIRTRVVEGKKFSEKMNEAMRFSTAAWVLLVGDDVLFRPGWLEAAEKLSDRFDVIGTNDAPDNSGNHKWGIQQGDHADHFFIRRAYIDQHGASLDGPGIVCHEGYRHYYVDREIVELAKRRGVWTPCLESVVEHLHPGLGKAEGDALYADTTPHLQADARIFRRRAALIGQA